MHVMVALDESGYAETILRWMRAFPWPKETRLKVVHVLEPLDVPDALGPKRYHQLLRQQREGAEALLARARKLLQKTFSEVETRLREGLPIYEILKLLRDLHPDLVVSGTRGVYGAKGLVLGSVSQRLLTYAPCSVMLIPAKVQRSDGLKVMLATDGSRGAKAAARLIADLPALEEVMVVTVVRPLDPRDLLLEGATGTQSRTMRAQILQGRRTAARRAIQETAEVLRSTSVPIRTRLLVGHPGSAIPQAARRERSDLLVLGSRGLTGLKAAALGSVSLAVAQLSHCPMLIVKPAS